MHGRQVADPPEAADADFSFPDPKRLVEVFNHQTDILMTKLEHKVDKGPFNIFQDIALCALDIICETAMGQHVSAQTKDFRIRPSRVPDVLTRREAHAHSLALEQSHVIKDRMSTFDAEQARVALSGLDEAEQGDNVDKIQQELDVVFGDSDRMATMNDLKDLKYLDCCIKEALRLYPSVPYFGRTTTEEAKLGQKFALLEEKAVLSALFRRFRVTTLQKVDELLPVGELILRPQNGVTVQLTSR
nr:hypothetical protein BaRGS_028485 [Batillaria attramentaria]